MAEIKKIMQGSPITYAGRLVRLPARSARFDKALVTGTADEIAEHGAAMGRGWTRAVEIMEQAGGDDDAYMIGQDARSGPKIAIGKQRGSC